MKFDKISLNYPYEKDLLMEKELMRMDYRIKAETDYGYIPIKEDIDEYEIVDIELEELNTHPHNFSELLEDELTDKEIEDLKTSFDTIGDIVILEIPDNLLLHLK